MDRVLGVARVGPHTCKLGTVYAMPLTLPIPNFRKNLCGQLLKNVKFCVLNKNYFLRMGNLRGILSKNRPQLTSMWPHSCHSQNSIKVVIVVLY